MSTITLAMDPGDRMPTWKRRIRWGLRAALSSAVVSAAGFGLEALGADLGLVPLILAVSGAVFDLGGLILALFAWSFADRQRRGRHSDGTPV